MINWDDDQEQVIFAPVDFRVLVTAPPGSGKTDVACARISYLIENQKIDPGRILLVSFAKTTVATLRERITRFSKEVDSSRILGVKISTIDSQAWKILNGFSEDSNFEKIFSSYSENIQSALQFLNNPNQDLVSYFHEFQHVVIDEAQDIIGERAELVTCIINSLSENTGITVLGDLQQAIYDFAFECSEIETKSSSNLIEIINESKSNWFIPVELPQNYRTKDPDLLDQQRKIRNYLLSGDLEREEYKQVYDLLKSIGSKADVELGGKKRKFILFRSRYEALLKASYSYQEKIPHKLKIGEMPHPIHPIIGIMFNDYMDTRLDFTKLKEIFDLKLSSFPNCSVLKNTNPNTFYEKLFRIAEDRSGRYVDMNLLKRKLANAPPEFCLNEIGFLEGATLSTIHAAKGMEAEHVTLMLPTYESDREFRFTEEGRVLYVGATRAIQILNVELSDGRFSSKLESTNRVFKFTQKGVQIEFGMNGDYEPISTIHTGLRLRGADQVHELQSKLIENMDNFIFASAERDRGGYEYRVHIPFKKGNVEYIYYLGDIAPNFYTDAKAICNKKVKGTSIVDHKFKYIGMYGLGSGVVEMGRIDRYKDIPVQYQKSGFYVYPILRGFCPFFPRKFNGQRG